MLVESYLSCKIKQMRQGGEVAVAVTVAVGFVVKKVNQALVI